MKLICLLANGVLLGGLAAAPFTAAQRSAPPQPTEQQKLKERVDALESQVKEAQTKADRAAMEKDYIERIQKEVNAYYEKAFATQIVVVAIIGLIVGLVGKFGVDHIIQSKLTEASATLREEFRRELVGELQKLKDSNAAQMKQLEESVQERIGALQRDLEDRSRWQFKFVQGLAGAADERYDNAKKSFREALEAYKSGRPRQLIERRAGVQTVRNIFVTLRRKHGDKFLEEATKELQDDLYDGLEIELAEVALTLAWLAPLVIDRKAGAPAPLPATPAAAPPTAGGRSTLNLAPEGAAQQKQ